MNWKTFKNIYVAHWREPWREGGGDEWLRQIESSTVSEGIMRRAVESLVARHNRIMADGGFSESPRLADVMAAYREAARTAGAAAATGPDRRGRLPCGVCDNGKMWIIIDTYLCLCVDPIHPPAHLVRPVAIQTICVCQDDVNGDRGELPAWFNPDLREALAAIEHLGFEPKAINPGDMLRNAGRTARAAA